MTLAAPGRAKNQDVGALAQPGVARRERRHLGLGDHRHAVEVERRERLAGRQPGLCQVPLHPPTATVCHLVLGKCCKEAGSRPAFLVGLLGELGPDQLDARQAQLAEQQLDARSVDRVGRLHATTSRLEVGSTAWIAASSS
jgi:hypothetical protein